MRVHYSTAARVVLALIVLMSAASARAQGVGFGVKLGPNFSTLSESDQDFSNSTGFQGGVFVGGNRHGAWGIQWEALYVKKGARQGSVSTDLRYLEVPVLLRINGTKAHDRKYIFSPYALVGPVFDVKLKASQGGVDVKDSYRNVDLGLLAGAGVEVHRLILEGRYTWGLINASSLAGGTASTIHTRSFAVMAGYRLYY